VEINAIQAAPDQPELQALREEIQQLADTLQMFANSETVPSPEEMIATLNGIGQGAMSCATLLKVMLIQADPNRISGKPSPADKRAQVREDAGEALRHCAELTRLLRRMRRNLSGLPISEIEALEDVARQLQAAIGSITAEWEDFC